MAKFIRLLMAVIVGFVGLVVRVSQPAAAQSPDTGWAAEYWNNVMLSGAPALRRTDANVDFDWGNGSPDVAISPNTFSARWTRYASLTTGTYRFTATADDGMRVWVDGALLINEWYSHPALTVSADKALATGQHLIVVEYYEDSGQALIHVGWAQTGQVIAGWRGEYYNNATLSGSPDLVRDDAAIDFRWNDGSPAPNTIRPDGFSARWTRTLDLPAGSYRFSLTVDDGARLWVNNQPVIDGWLVQGEQTYTADIFVPGGATPLKLEYFENTGLASVQLKWTAISTAPTPVAITNWRGEYYNNTDLSGSPALVRDDAAIDFNWRDGSPAAGVVNADGFSARWTRTLAIPAGRYRFMMTVDDGGRVWVNDQLLLDAWRVQSAQLYSAEISLPGGPVSIRMEYFDNAGNAVAGLSWAVVPVAAPTVAPAPTPTAIPLPPQSWRGEYFNNTALSGAPVLVRDDRVIDFDWDAESPAPGVVGIDGFSVRWTRSLNLAAGWYRFSMSVDDGGRLWVNNQLLIDAWQVQVAQRFNADVYLPDGVASMRMEYYENSGIASASLTWQPVAAAEKNWRGEYYNNVTLSGAPALVRDDAAINFNWSDGSPAPGVVNADNFSARWTRTLRLEPGWYRFTLVVDDGGRLSVNNQLLIDAWQIQGSRPYDGEIYIPAGDTTIKLEYFENTGWANAQLAWKPVAAPTLPRTVIVDDTDVGFVRNGPSINWNTAPEGYGARLTWLLNRERAGQDERSARWTPMLVPGNYEVFVFVPDRYTTSAQARYTVSHAGGQTQRTMNQSTLGNRWVSLGVYRFRGTGDDYVMLTDLTGEPDRTRLLAFDAVKWEPR